MNAKPKPAIVPVTLWTTVDFDVVPHVVVGPMKRVRSARQSGRIPALAGGMNRLWRTAKTLRHGRRRW